MTLTMIELATLMNVSVAAGSKLSGRL